jgi:alkylation response protein AidB-like acyl-CoA dehydrogenase
MPPDGEPAAEREHPAEPRPPSAGGLSPAVRELEESLGDPWRADSVLSFEAALAAEEKGELVWPALEALTRWGMPAALLPGSGSVADGFGLLRAVARRDPQLAVAYGSTFLGAVPVWLFGGDSQRRWLAGRIGAGDLGSCAISERAHGSDLASGELRADRHPGGYWLTGEKWPVGNAQRSSFATLLARTGDHAFSLLLLDKAKLPTDRWRGLPRAATLGLRGHDLSGLAFEDCPAPEHTLIGTAGTGLAQILKTLQVTRSLVSGVSLGVLDSALRLAIDYARQRRLYNAPLTELPAIRDILLRSYLTLLIGECVAVPIARAVTVAPQRLARWSAVSKYLVPVLAERALAELASVLSARYYIQDELASRVFAKLQRDHAAMSIFDGTTHVTLAGLAAAAGPGTDDPAGEPVRAGLFGWDRPAPPWQPDGEALRLAGHGPDEILGDWVGAVTAVGEPTHRDLQLELESWHSLHARYRAEVLARQAGPVSARALHLARIHTVLHAAASCLQVWRYGRGWLPAPFADPGWLVVTLQRLRQELDGEQELAPRYAAAVEQVMYDQYDRGLSFSLHPYPLGR